MIPQDVWDKVLYAGSLAPSGHNSQPWRFARDGDCLRLHDVPDASFHNHNGKGSRIAQGAALENMAIAAGALGYRAVTEIFPDPSDRHLVATVALGAGPVRDAALAAAIPLRCTNRKPYRDTPLSDAHRAALLQTPAEVGGGLLKLFEDRASRGVLGRVGALNERVMFENPSLHRWFFTHLRWTEEEERREPAGLYLKTLELAKPQEWILRVARRWGAIQVFNRLGFSRQVEKENAALNSSAVIGMILVRELSDQECVRAGRLLERLWLKATSVGLSIQPLIGTIFMQHRVRAGDAAILSAAHRTLLTDTASLIERTCRVNPEQIAALFRVGYSDPPSGRSSRYPMHALMEKGA